MTDPRPVCTEKTQDIIKTLRSNAQVEAALELAVKQQEKRIADQRGDLCLPDEAYEPGSKRSSEQTR